MFREVIEGIIECPQNALVKYLLNRLKITPDKSIIMQVFQNNGKQRPDFNKKLQQKYDHTKDISPEDGSDLNVKESKFSNQVVSNGKLKVRVGGMNKFTTIEFTSTN